MQKLERRIRRNLMKIAYRPVVGSLARRCAAFGLPPLYGPLPLAGWHSHGFISPDARVAHPQFTWGDRCFVARDVIIYQDNRGGKVELGNGVHIHENTTIQTGHDGCASIGDATHIQPRCQISAYCGEVTIGQRVEIAPGCAIYPYNHSMVANIPIREQPLYSRKGVIVEDDAWLGFGVVLLDGAHIGAGAVVAANSVVNSVIPANAIAAGAPARVVGNREESQPNPSALKLQPSSSGN